MADSLVGATVKVLLERILSFATDKIALLYGFKKDIASLKESAAMIQAVLADAEKKQQQMEAVKLWLKKIEEVANEADNVLDQLNYEFLRRTVETNRDHPLKNKVCLFFLSSRTVNLRWRMARKVRDINKKLKSINEEASGFGLQLQVASETTIPLATTELNLNRETDSVIDQNVVGRTNDSAKLLGKLFNPSSGEIVSFIPITGMAGLGKTTLAQLVYNDPQIDNYFDRKIWVCISDNFDISRVLKLILESLWRKKVDIVSRDAIVQEIKKELQGKRYLLVLDDVWCESSKIWNDFLRSLLGISTVKGNWSLVTTRLLTVASIVATNHPLTLEKLSDDDSWTIVKGKAFPNGELPEELNALKEEILRACQGVPLVASIIGGLLHVNAKEQWLSIIRNEIPNMTAKGDNVMQILRLSFDHLPSASIKKCFAYCLLFRKGSNMEKDMLIQLWMAEGFLQPNHGNEMEMEEIGLRYFDILVKSSLFQKVTNEYRFICGRMHDLVHDLARFVSESETITLEQGVGNDKCPVRYLALESLQEDMHTILKERSTSLRSVFLECGISNDLLWNFKCLRVLNLSRVVKFKRLSNAIGNLIHLRYLDLSYTKIESWPESLCKLFNLQILRILGCDSLTKLPEGMSSLISLRHLHCYFSTEKFQMPLRMGKLTCLQTLEFFNIGPEKGRQIEEIGRLTNLKGRLTVRNLELINGKEGARLGNLFAKSKLTSLSLKWARDREGDNDDENVLEGLEPHPNLQKLVVKNFMGSWFPSWIMKMGCMVQRRNLIMGLKNLVNLKLINCRSCEEIPALGQLPLLKSLLLCRLEEVRCIGFAFYGVNNGSRSDQLSKQSFPALQNLQLYGLFNLVNWMGVETMSTTGEGVKVFPSLENLTIENCPRLMTTPNHFPCLKRLKLWNAGRNIELLVSSICSNVTTLTALKIRAANELNCVPDVVLSKNQNLASLHLVDCHLTNVMSFSISKCENLKDLYIHRCANLRSVFFPTGGQLPSSLQCLEISLCNELSCLPGELIQACTSLKSLQVYDCPNLVSFPVDLQHTPSLSFLRLFNCPKLITVPRGFGSCINIRELTIGPFSDSMEFDWSTLSSSSIRKLKLHGRPDAVSLPDQLSCLTELTELSILDFESIESLPDWLENLSSLEQLNLSNCHKLTYLPSVAAMRCLTSLRRLWIEECPMLKNGCTPSRSHISEWSKISHIPKIFIDNYKIKV